MSLTDYLRTEAPVNIFRELRLASGLSHDVLAKRMNTSKRALIWLEQGTYEKPLPVALAFWLNAGRFLPGVGNSGIRITELTLVEGYESYKEQTREQNRHYFGPSPCYLHFGLGGLHPYAQLKARARACGNGDSTNEIAKALCIPQSTLSLWERKWRTQHSVPKTFQEAMLAIGYTRAEVHNLVQGYPAWRELNK